MMPHDTGSVRDADVLERFGIDDGAERLRLLRALADSRERVTLHTADDADCHVVSCVLGVDAADGTIELEFNTDEARRDAFVGSASVTAVALLDRVTLQFELARCALVGDGEQVRLQAPLPLGLVRLQRRDAFRVEPSRSAVPRLWLRERGGERAVRILDVSATGLAFEIAPAWAPAGSSCPRRPRSAATCWSGQSSLASSRARIRPSATCCGWAVRSTRSSPRPRAQCRCS